MTLSTKEQLIIAGGELFAEHGYDGVSTRMIAEKAGVNLGSIHYHFGSKENVYVASFLYAMDKKSCNGLLEVLEENPTLADHPTGQAEIIRTAVYRNFHELFKPEKPQWERRILIREIVKPSSALPVLVEKVFAPDKEKTYEFYQKIKPGADIREANAWMDILHAQVVFYAATEEILELVRGVKITDATFYREAARTVSRAMILQLDLPLPEDLKN